jgi:hypothetical protein
MISDEIYSLDLSSATDRFPISLQKRLLKNLVQDGEYGERWADLMSNREFHYKGKPYKWSVGQPLGSLSSWPTFALTHHLVVRYCAKVTNSPLDYYLLGDDIVIKGKTLAEKYISTIKQLGVNISFEKSLTGKSAEFCKRIFYKGVEISPAPVKMITSLLKDMSLIRETCNHISKRSSRSLNKTPTSLLVEDLCLIKGINPQQFIDLNSSPVPLKEQDMGSSCLSQTESEVKTTWAQITKLNLKQIQLVYLSIACKKLRGEIKILQNSTQKEWDILNKMEIPGLAPGSTVRNHSPIAIALDNRLDQLLLAYQKVVTFENERKFMFGSVNEVIIPNLNILSIEVNPKSKKAIKLEKLIIMKTLNACLALEDYMRDHTLDSLDDTEIYNIITETNIPV